MLKLRLTLSLFFGLLLTAFSQKDSLENIILTAENDTVLMNSYLEMSDVYYRILPDSCQYFAEKSYQYALKLHDRYLIPVLENIIGLCELHKESYLDALFWFKKSLHGLIAIQSERSVLMALNNIGACYSELQQPVRALPFLLKAQEYSEKLKHFDVLMLSELNLGNVYGDLNQLELSEEFFRKSRNRITIKEDPYNYSLNTFNIANILMRDSEKTEEIVSLLKESFEISMNYQFYNLAFMATNNLTTFYLDTNHLNLDSAEKWLHKSDIILEKNSYPTAELFQKIAYSQFFRAREEYDKGLAALIVEEGFIDEIQEGELKYKYQFELAKSYEKLGDFKNAYKFFKSASIVNESLYNDKNTKIFADLKNNHELEKKDQEIALSKKDNALKDQKISADQNRIRLFIWGTVFLV